MRRILLYILISIFTINHFGCAYFNTFYFTKKHFKNGLKTIEKDKKASQRNQTNSASANQRRQNNSKQNKQNKQDNPLKGEKISTAATMHFTKCIEMGSKLLENYPTSKWVDDTLYLLGRSFFPTRVLPPVSICFPGINLRVP